ncbi:MAG: hypothetical protein C5B59_10410 [Bacteroidetes bacterium]|nr:MAG: hypothetical protein C5B59_10410 [Bacteroidota bacterium]
MRIITVMLAVLMLVSCSDKERVPRGIIQKEEMSKILWDIIQADQFHSLYMVKDSAKYNVKAETMELYDQVFRIHHTTKEDFDKSFQFYLAHPDITKEMFDSLSVKANRRRGDVYKINSQLKKS